ncbi:MAG: YfaZ family protein [Agarilytica sp.]
MTLPKHLRNLSLAILAAASQTQAGTLDADLNNETLHARYNINSDKAQVGLSLDGMFTDDKGEALYFTAKTQGKLGNSQNIRGGFGGRAYWLSPDQGDDLQAFALGGYVSVVVPQAPDLTIGAELFYAPSITVSDDWENVKHLELRVSYQLFENAAVYMGIRQFELEYDAPAFVDDDVEVDDGVHFGFSLQF